MKVFLCRVCGHAAFDNQPAACPSCGAGGENFSAHDTIFEESMEKSKEGAHKHVPEITINKECGLLPGESCTDVIVRIGETLHPMEEKHHIEFIDCYVDGAFISRVYLTPGVYAAGCFHLKAGGSRVRVVEHCNIHGYWQAEADL